MSRVWILPAPAMLARPFPMPWRVSGTDIAGGAGSNGDTVMHPAEPSQHRVPPPSLIRGRDRFDCSMLSGLIKGEGQWIKRHFSKGRWASAK